ncbi:MAG TPA: CoA pyrophosphatase [Xanthobacteraceae bacterium]|nr:CoA pyrophosphatase [Xanthobacteraceae bacterium]
MTYPFDDALRREIAGRCAAFPRLPAGEAARGLKPAAVAITLVEAEDGSGSAAFLLTRRAAGLRAHRNQWALPGGRCDHGETLIAAALRELREEIGLTVERDAALGMLDDYPSRSGYIITPVVVWAGSNPRIRANPDEVASVHRIELSEITRPDVVDFISIPESERRVVRLHIAGAIIHAPTAAVIYQFGELLAGRTTRVAEFEQPVFAWK